MTDESEFDSGPSKMFRNVGERDFLPGIVRTYIDNWSLFLSVTHRYHEREGIIVNGSDARNMTIPELLLRE